MAGRTVFLGSLLFVPALAGCGTMFNDHQWRQPPRRRTVTKTWETSRRVATARVHRSAPRPTSKGGPRRAASSGERGFSDFARDAVKFARDTFWEDPEEHEYGFTELVRDFQSDEFSTRLYEMTERSVNDFVDAPLKVKAQKAARVAWNVYGGGGRVLGAVGKSTLVRKGLRWSAGKGKQVASKGAHWAATKSRKLWRGIWD